MSNTCSCGYQLYNDICINQMCKTNRTPVKDNVRVTIEFNDKEKRFYKLHKRSSSFTSFKSCVDFHDAIKLLLTDKQLKKYNQSSENRVFKVSQKRLNILNIHFDWKEKIKYNHKSASPKRCTKCNTLLNTHTKEMVCTDCNLVFINEQQLIHKFKKVENHLLNTSDRIESTIILPDEVTEIKNRVTEFKSRVSKILEDLDNMIVEKLNQTK